MTGGSSVRGKAMSVFWTRNLPRGVPKVDECSLAEIGNSKKRHVAHNLDRFEPRGA
jgi:hypothetical protein